MRGLIAMCVIAVICVSTLASCGAPNRNGGAANSGGFSVRHRVLTF